MPSKAIIFQPETSFCPKITDLENEDKNCLNGCHYRRLISSARIKHSSNYLSSFTAFFRASSPGVNTWFIIPTETTLVFPSYVMVPMLQTK